MPYRDDFSASSEQVHLLRRELEETKAALADLQVRYGRAMAALKVVAEGKRIEKILEEVPKRLGDSRPARGDAGRHPIEKVGPR